MKFTAVLHGADPKELEKKGEVEDRKNNLLFGDPEEYKNWSEEDKNKI